MKRESSLGIEEALKQTGIVLQSRGCTPLQVKTIPRLSCYVDALAKEAKKDPADNELFLYFKKAVALVLDEVGEQSLAEQVQAFTTLEQLAPVLKNAFDIRQPQVTMDIMRGLFKMYVV